MSAPTAIINVAGKTYDVTAAAHIPAGRWDVSATVPGSSWVWLTVRINGAATPLVPGEADGTLSLDVPVGDILITWNGQPGTGKTNRVVVKSVKPAEPKPDPQPVPVRRATIGIITQHGTTKRIEADRRLAQKSPALRFVTSDFDPATRKLSMQPASAAPERSEVAFLNAANPAAIKVACAMNLWGKPGERSYEPIQPIDARNWAWLALDTWGDQVDIVLGPNEADSYKYNAHVRADRSNYAGALKHLHELWAEAAQVFRAAGLRVGGPAHIRPESMRIWERDYGTLTDVVTCHGYMDRRPSFAREMRALADAKGGIVVVDEIAAEAVKRPDGTVDSNATIAADVKLLNDWSPHVDVLLKYVGRSDATEIGYDDLACLAQDGTPKPLLAAVQPLIDASPRRPRTQIDLAAYVYTAIAGARRAEGLRPLRPSADLARQARRTAEYVSRYAAQSQITGDVLRTASGEARTSADVQSIGGVSIATRLSPSIIREDAAGWRSSASHRPLLLSESATEVGAGVTMGTSRYGGQTIPTAYFWAAIR